MHKLSNRYQSSFTVFLSAFLLLIILLSARYGAVDIGLEEIFSSFSKWLAGNEAMTLHERIFLEIRLPRAILCVLVGACLSMGGVLMQALFRNPIVESGLIGTSSGAALGAAMYLVLGATWGFSAGEWTLPLAACLGGTLTTILVLVLSQSRQTGRSSIVTLLLTGIAINAFCMSGVGFLSYIARDPQARSVTFWNLGTLSGANWHSVSIVGFTTITCGILALRYARQLNALMLGEDEAELLGISIKQLKFIVLAINVSMVAVATAFVGVIGFVGLIVPHLLRMLYGSDNRFLIRNSALMGAVLLSLADLIARLLLKPAELPIGIITSVVGVPMFIVLLRRKSYFF